MNCYLSFKQTLLVLFFKLPTPISRLLSRTVGAATQSIEKILVFNKGKQEGLMIRHTLDHGRDEVTIPHQAH